SGKIKAIQVREGEYVKENETLAILQNPKFLELQQKFQKSASSLQYLRTEYTRKKTLYDNEVGSAKSFQKAKIDYETVKSTYYAIKEKLQLLGVNTQHVLEGHISPSIQIRSPISGYITHIFINTGQH